MRPSAARGAPGACPASGRSLQACFEPKLGHLTQKGETGEGLRYALRHRGGLTLYLDDGDQGSETGDASPCLTRQPAP
jgi:hypothetical protein